MTDDARDSMERMNSATDAALSVVDMEKKQALLQMTEQQQREFMIAQCHEVIGRVQATNLMSKFGNVASLVYLKEVKESKIYKDLPSVGTWDKFCEYIGLSRRKVDEDLLNLATFGEEFLETCCQLSVGYRDLKKLRQLSHDGTVSVDQNTIRIGDDEIPFSPDNAEDLQAAIESVLDSKSRQIEDAEATIRAKDKVLKAKEQVINKQEKTLSVLENRAKKNGLKPEEEAFCQECQNARITIDGFFAKFDPELNPLPDGHTARMRAELMETLGYFVRVTKAAFDTAGDLYGVPELDDGWVPPHLRQDSDNGE